MLGSDTEIDTLCVRAVLLVLMLCCCTYSCVAFSSLPVSHGALKRRLDVQRLCTLAGTRYEYVLAHLVRLPPYSCQRYSYSLCSDQKQEFRENTDE